MKRTNRLSKIITVFLVTISIPLLLLAGTAENWNVDVPHSSVGFSVNHFFTPVNGQFDDYKVVLNFDPENLEGSSINAEIKVASVNTDNGKRDTHLQSGDFFDAEKYPTMTFISNKIISKGENDFVAQGKLKIKNVEKDVELPFKLLGIKKLPEKMQKMMGGVKQISSYQATLKINRNDYDVGTGSWAATLVVGNEVTINIVVEGNQM